MLINKKIKKDWDSNNVVSFLKNKNINILITITTYKRQKELIDILENLSCSLKITQYSYFVLVLHDGLKDVDLKNDLAKFEIEIISILHRLFGNNAAILFAARNHGKREFWKTHHFILNTAKIVNCDYLLSMQDDLDFSSDIINTAFKMWKSIKTIDSEFHVLSLFSTETDDPFGRWINFFRIDFSELKVRRTDWFDLPCFLIDRRGLAILNFSVLPISPKRWSLDCNLSSGVGEQLTRRLFNKCSIYQCYPPLVFHGKSTSEMHYQERMKNPLDNRNLSSS